MDLGQGNVQSPKDLLHLSNSKLKYLILYPRLGQKPFCLVGWWLRYIEKVDAALTQILLESYIQSIETYIHF